VVRAGDRRARGAFRAAQHPLPSHAGRAQARPETAWRDHPRHPGQAEWLDRAGVQRVGRVVGVRDGLPQLDDGQVLDVTNVIWCTGFRHDFPWIDLPGFDEHGRPEHTRGVSSQVPGLYFLGLQFQFALASASLWGVGRDAAYLVMHLAKRPTVPEGAEHAAAAAA
jgi:putative flavoprotein involved in K+ transport